VGRGLVPGRGGDCRPASKCTCASEALRVPGGGPPQNRHMHASRAPAGVATAAAEIRMVRRLTAQCRTSRADGAQRCWPHARPKASTPAPAHATSLPPPHSRVPYLHCFVLSGCALALACQVRGFANSIATVDGGTHLEGLRSGLSRVVTALGRAAKLIKARSNALRAA
jgi:hypothetical protein